MLLTRLTPINTIILLYTQIYVGKRYYGQCWRNKRVIHKLRLIIFFLVINRKSSMEIHKTNLNQEIKNKPNTDQIKK